MEQCILNPERSKAEPQLPRTGILAVNPSDTTFLADYAGRNGLTRHFLFNSNLYSSEHLFLAGPAVGAPMAVLCLEKLIALGAEKIILYGWCGSLQEELAAMDILLPTGAVAEEGTSCHYPVADNYTVNPEAPDNLQNRIAEGLQENGLSFLQGAVWTTDAPYRETVTRVKTHQAARVYGVDMEYSALCTVAAFRGVELAAVMLVSDELWRTPWKPHYSFKVFKKRSRSLLKVLCGLAPFDTKA